MNKNSNTYIIIYATVMVVVVASVLAFASMFLQERQNANVENETKGAILLSIGEGRQMAVAKDKTAYINEQYDKYIVESFVVDSKGERHDSPDAFTVLKNLKAEYDKPAAERLLPIFISRSDDGKTRYVLPLWGTGLWGPVWGYIALESNLDTVYGAVFDHKGETPGLGAEIAGQAFQNQFKGKSIFRDGQMTSISMTKGAGSSAGNPNAVDAISGGTITSRGVENMIKGNLGDYLPFIEIERGRTADGSQAAVDGAAGTEETTAGIVEGDGSETGNSATMEETAGRPDDATVGETGADVKADKVVAPLGEADGPTAIIISALETDMTVGDAVTNETTTRDGESGTDNRERR